MRSAGAGPANLLPQTASLAITTVVLTAAIAVGLVIPFVLPLHAHQGSDGPKS
jgi:hypothetical protein